MQNLNVDLLDVPHLFGMIKEYNMIDYSELINKFEIGKYETRKIAELAKKVNEAGISKCHLLSAMDLLKSPPNMMRWLFKMGLMLK